MKYEIDQSGKIERTSRDTILCLSNEVWDAVVIKAETKRQLQEIFRRNGQPRNFIIFTFCAGLAILLQRNKEMSDVIIDKKYFGKEAVIKNIVLEMLNIVEKSPELYFDLIGKSTKAHHRAYAIAIKKLPAPYITNLKEILGKIKMTEVGKRLKNA